uniref:Uncharacterized protein n=1 Tax=Anguilla anguilla TaxID=7936 RepID=A0A0E9PZX0_ANGAN
MNRLNPKLHHDPQRPTYSLDGFFFMEICEVACW